MELKVVVFCKKRMVKLDRPKVSRVAEKNVGTKWKIDLLFVAKCTVKIDGPN